MAQTTFYHLDNNDERATTVIDKACQLAGELYQQGQRVFIATMDAKTSEAIDELMWQQPPAKFIPHNLQGEGPHYGAPIEIGHQPPQGRRHVLINLCHPLPPFAVNFSQIIDFIPSESEQKQQARERFHQCRVLNLAPQLHQD
ncbi:DNA polymerase III subunit chi [Psychrobium sp. 1_MG-2023]|uniref:DNA polymerase III subunit chi n=1 Tax=Psychrobium sp. 1_MG-2023 TaxID=3062624 RepID=UPI000C331F4F|nr:DNA polymerase III subunit chi [Psychrobium sp. 1_MG-2023]MDP2559617.1 DNA polymerase III subunit chi [Psychrobium sp. 1_MG-2023]PKF59451.1 DNA polymerase III subunit chi [Alteromonadales bacterium alter-6D02]